MEKLETLVFSWETTIENYEWALSEICQRIYQKGERRIQPRYPWVLVRVLPHEQQVRSIILPDSQNKTVYEGIVLATWQPFWREYQGVSHDEDVVIDGKILMRSAVEVGQRVAFPDWDGLPVPFLDEKKYRLIHETEVHPKGGILGIIDYQADKDLREKLEEVFKDTRAVTVSGV